MAQPFVLLADEVLRLRADILEEDFAELGRATDQLDRRNRDAGALQIKEDEADAVVLGRLGIGSNQTEHPVGIVLHPSSRSSIR